MRTGTAVAAPGSSNQINNRTLLRATMLGAAAAVVAVAVARPALAGTETWTGANAANWNNAGNWTGDNLPPAANDVLIFDGASNLTTNNDYAANTQFNGITFAAGAGAFALNGNAVLLGGDINNNSANAETINLGLVLDGATVNVNRTGGGALSLGSLTLGLAAQSTNVSTLNVNQSVSATSLRVQTNSTSINTINIANGAALTVNGAVNIGTPPAVSGATLNTWVTFAGGGDLVVNSVSNSGFFVGLGQTNLGANSDRNIARVDMTQLTNFTFNGGATGTGIFGVGRATRPDGQLRLASGSNTITADALEVGNSAATPGLTGTNNNNGGVVSRLFLGTGTNTLNVDNVRVGDTKGVGSIEWQGSTGSVVIAGQAGGTSTANITVGRQSSATGTNTTSTLSLAGHQATVQAGTVIVGNANGATSAGTIATGAVTFDTGTFNASSIQLGVSQTGASGGANGTFTLGTDASSTGVLNVSSSFYLGNKTNTTSSAASRATFVINGGTANVNADIQVSINASDPNDNSVLTLAGGTLNMMGHNVGSAASPVKTINLNGGTLSNAGLVSGTAVTLGGVALNNVAKVTAPTMTVSAPLNVTGGTTLSIPAGGTLAAASPLDLVSGVTVAGGTSAGAGNVTGNVTAKGGSYVSPGDATTAGTLQFANDLSFESGSSLRIKLSPDSGSGNDLLSVSGNLSLAGTVNLAIGALGTGAAIGQVYTVASYGGTLTGDQTNIAIIGPGSRKTFTVVPTAGTPNQIQVSVGGSDPLSLTYVGNGSSAWSAVGATNFRDGSLNPQQFYNLDTVTFDDASTNMADVQLTGALLAGGVTVSAARDYKFAGTGSLAGTTGLTKALGGTLVVTTNNTNTGTTDIQGGTVRVGDGGTSGSLGSGAINDNGTLAFHRSDTVTIANTIGGGGGVAVEGGTVLLTGANTYTGTTTVASGTLKVSAGNSTGDTNGAAITVANGATFDIGGNATANNYNLGAKTIHIAGNGVGGTAGAVTNSGGATQNNAFNNITLDADALMTGARIDIGRTAAVSSRTLDLGGHTLTVSMSGTQPMFAVLDGTTVTAGNIVVDGAGSSLGLERSLTMDNIGGTITFNPGTVFQAYQNTSGAVKRPMVFKGNNTIGSGSTTLAIVDSAMTLNGDVTLQSTASGVPNAANNPLQLAGNISGVGGITKVGTNSVTLSGTNTYAGATAVNAGTLVLGGSSTGSSSLAVADGATVQVVNGGAATERFGALNLNATGKFDIDGAKLVLGGTSSSTLVSYLQRGYAGGAWTGTGLMSTSAQSAADPSRVHAIGWAVAGDAGLTGKAWGAVASLGATDIAATLTYYGDLNLDGQVNGDDYTLLDRYVANSGGLGATSNARWIDGDLNYDGKVDQNDYMLIDTSFGVLHPGGLSPEFLATREAEFGDAYVSQLIAAVPEPTTVGLLAAGSLLGLRRRRRQ